MLKRIKRRYETAASLFPQFYRQLSFASALRGALRQGYSLETFKADLLSGLVVGIVALPLSMALAIATGVAPQHGIYTAIIAGGLIALLGGSPTQVSGPTAAFVVVLVPISAKYGPAGLLLASAMAGVILFFLGAARLGRLIQFVPYPVTTGFTAGIGVVIATLQLKDFLGLRVEHMPEHYFERVHALGAALPTTRWPDLAIGALTLGILIFFPKISRRVPAPLVALATATIAAFALARLVPGFKVDTIGTRFSYVADGVTHPGIPRLPPLPILPWELAGPGGAKLSLTFHLVRELVPSAFAIAMLGAIESLLSAVVADGMAGTKHDPDGELMAQGIGNLVAPFFGGFAATGAIARTATNIRSGGRTPVSAVIHALFILFAVMALAPVLAYLPMASLAALLLLVAYNMSELKHFAHVLRVAPKSDAFVQLACFTLTVAFDMVVSVTAGVLLAAVLFMRRMAEISGARVIDEPHLHGLRKPLPRGVVLYDIAGPLFFGAAQAAMSALEHIAEGTRVVILDLEDVPAMDATGLVNLESALERLHQEQTFVILAGVQPQPAKVLAKAGIEKEPGRLAICTTVDDAVDLARVIRDKNAPAMMTPLPGGSV
jgi:SulP family sulfate permease